MLNLISEESKLGELMPKRGKCLPLTIAQRGLWAAEKIGPANAMHSIAEYLEIHGDVDVELFLKALQQLAAEAETLRVQIKELNGLPYQIVAPMYQGEFPYLDFSGNADSPGRALAWMQQEVKRPLKLASDPLWFNALIKVAQGRYFWYQRSHHIIMDGFSGGLVARRVSEIYNAQLAGEQAPAARFGSLESLVEKESHYRDSPRFIKDKRYWQSVLAQLPEPVSLAKQWLPSSSQILRETQHLPQCIAEPLRQLAQRMNCSVPQTLIALTAVYLYRMSACGDDFILGVPVTARSSREMRRVPAMVANALPLRLRITPKMRFCDLLQQVSRSMARALRHQQYRYEDMRRDLNMTADGQQIVRLGVNVEPFDCRIHFGKHPVSIHNLCNAAIEDLTIFIYDHSGDAEIDIDIDANAGLYSQEELANHGRRLLAMMAKLVAQPEQDIQRVDLLDCLERRKILEVWNNTAADIAPAAVIDRFWAEVEKNPQRPAVISDHATLSYGELAQRVHSCAGQLASAGVASGSIVALAQPRRSDMLVALLAVLQTGAAYLPLDMAWPPARLHSIVQQAQPAALLAHSEQPLAQRITELCPTLHIDKLPAELSHSALPLPSWNADARAYVIYTSGSSGEPKGVVVTQSALCNVLVAMQEQLQLHSGDRVLATTTVAFDIAAIELLLPLITGAAVVLAGAKHLSEPRALVDYSRRQGVTVMQATPSLWQMLVPRYSNALRGVRPLCCGEALSGQLARDLATLRQPVLNLYGPTEATIFATQMVLKSPQDFDAPPIGRPLRNVRVYVLDRQMQPLPPGVEGDLYIAGEGLARGYLQRDDLTQAAFIQHPIDASGRLYRSGDRARWRDDGVLEYLGRADKQIKIRGYRVELGEVEACLNACAEVQQSAVVCDCSAGGQTLVAYVVPANPRQSNSGLSDSGLSNAALSNSEHSNFAHSNSGQGAALSVNKHSLLSKLEASLPSYMLPTQIVPLPQLPLTANGKLDRQALPAASVSRPADTGYVAPRTAMEASLAAIWQQVLGLERVGIYDDFFQLGGNSFNVAEVLAAIRQKMALDLPLVALFKASTIGELATQLQQNCAQDLLQPLLQIKPGAATPLFCIHPVLGLSWSYSALLKHLPQETAVYGLQAASLYRGEEPPASIEEMAQRYLRHIRHIQPRGPYQLLGWSMGGLVAHAIVEALQQQGEQVSFFGMLDSYLFRQSPPQQPADLVRSGLKFLGYEPDKLQQVPHNMQALGEYLCSEYGIRSLPAVQALQKDYPRILEHLSHTVEHNLSLARRFQPGGAVNKLLFFVADKSQTGTVDKLLHHSAAAWQPYVSQAVEVSYLPCTHQEMLNANFAATIGREIGKRLLRDGPGD
ncbi:MAG: amino acid adenylation domain-containing protein [Cellvibrionaceae bacterium]|nr:amino acid adenylation domain-containing protein [Cellvibrionaceae bacterium]